MQKKFDGMTFEFGTHLNEQFDTKFENLNIPPQLCAKFTVGPDKMPDVCINAWQQIWKMSAADFGGERAYIADFEVYDERSSDHNNVTLDIYIGVKRRRYSFSFFRTFFKRR